jgi:hypothetical protein
VTLEFLELLVFAAGDPPGDFGAAAPSWLQLSAVAVLVVLMGVALRVAYRFANVAYQREVKRADDCQAKYDALAQKVMDQYVPTATEAARVMADVIAEVRVMRDQERRR